MNHLIVEKTFSTPYIHFNPESGELQISGESFPENASRFYTPVVHWIREYLHSASVEEIRMNIEILYFNSSTSKVFMNIFEILENAVENGKNIIVTWKCKMDNESAIECGEEFKEDLDTLPFHIEIY